jgi:pimeloyl-ACP methyl ester carboxylesterase
MQLASPTIGSPARTTDAVSLGTLEQGSGDPILLFHGILGTPQMWSGVLPLLATSEYHAIALPALGHAGGRRCEQRPARIEHVVDDAERALDALQIDRAHLVGNSMGGWVALELSRRGRARTVTAFSPAGMWEGSSQTSGRAKLRVIVQLTRATRALLPWTSRIAAIRKFGLRDNAVHGERATPAMMVALADAVLACNVADDLLATPETFAPLEITCPTQIVWSAEDRIFPVDPFAATARQRVPGALHSVLEGVGHVPMLDDAGLVAETILRQVERAPVELEHDAARV